MIRLSHLPTDRLTPAERGALDALIGDAVESLVPPGEVRERYCARYSHVCLAYDRGRAVAFQFYQWERVAGMPLARMGLTGKARDWRGGGVARRMSVSVLLRGGRALLPHNLPRPFAVLARIENPKAYAGLLDLGGDIFPDLFRPGRPCRHTALYRKATEIAGIAGDLDFATGVSLFRTDRIGFRHRAEAYRPDHPSPANRRFHEHLCRNGGAPGTHNIIFLVVTTPARALATAALRSATAFMKGRQA